jgi:hypothetical protein
MKQVLAWLLISGAAIHLSSSGTCRAAVQGRDWVYWLGIGDWRLCPQGKGVFLVKTPWDREESFRGDPSGKWTVSAPTIEAANGKFLASDPAGRKPSVHLVAKQGANTRWAFEFISRLRPKTAKYSDRFQEGPKGFTFRVKLAAGPFKGWYLAAEKRTIEKQVKGKKGKSKKIALRPLKLVRDVKKATTFTYIEENYFVSHP